ncbi:MAG: efflux RND transporter periplasmic adaptor subunit [Acidobacteria bacterium]|nr:efflux RND transporter periplasmic adaptor subunit [Acidobacteriota bacterium]
MRGAPGDDPAFTWVVDRGDLVSELVEPGTLRAVRSLTYRSPVNGRELEIVQLAEEGVHVDEGDVLARLETRDLEADLRQAESNVQDVALARQVADLELLEATAELASTRDGEGALTLEESRANLTLTEKKVDRLQREVRNLEPLLERGFITGEELERSQAELEAAEAELTIARRRAKVLLEQTHPVGQRRAELQLAQKRAQRDAVNRRLVASRRRVAEIRGLIERCTIQARSPGLIVYEEFMASSPRRKIRLGDRVTPSQGIVRVVEVSRMLVDTSVPERSIHRVRAGQPVTVRLEAFPDLELSGRVATIGVLARIARDGMDEAKRFDVTVELNPTGAELRPEMTARVDILVGDRRDVVRLPVNALFERDGMTLVNALHEGRVEVRQVELGEQNRRFVEILAGVAEGDQVMVVGQPGDDGTDAPPAGGVEAAGLGLRMLANDDYRLGPTR